ncbi:MAG TPA: (2Fe-2S)-binding protein [Candidatus Merdenecus merdavium]|nr:(2Fe-2S)-binding protein [Candidatus Merdenecus merdavium]
MTIKVWLNGKEIEKDIEKDIEADLLLLDFLRQNGCYSVKRGCETSNCGLCTVLMNGTPVLSCNVLAARADGKNITTIEGLQEEAEDFGRFLADQGAEQCGYCSPGFIMNVLAMVHELEDPTETEIKEYLSGNLCRCTGYVGQLRAIKLYLSRKREESK